MSFDPGARVRQPAPAASHAVATASARLCFPNGMLYAPDERELRACGFAARQKICRRSTEDEQRLRSSGQFNCCARQDSMQPSCVPEEGTLTARETALVGHPPCESAERADNVPKPEQPSSSSSSRAPPATPHATWPDLQGCCTTNNHFANTLRFSSAVLPPLSSWTMNPVTS